MNDNIIIFFMVVVVLSLIMTLIFYNEVICPK